MCSKNEYTKSESNSQLCRSSRGRGRDCVQRTNIQNLKAIHNGGGIVETLNQLCSKNEYTKSESNSQHKVVWIFGEVIVFKERIYKIWKQFTTAAECLVEDELLCSKNEYTKSESNSQLLLEGFVEVANCVQRTNIQNLKAIHNRIKSLCQFFAHFSCWAFSTL